MPWWALAADRLMRLPAAVASVMSWAGLVAIVFACVHFNANTAYPGAPVAIPVVGATLIIAGGTAVPGWGAELLLGTPPFGWVGRLSYSLYLWHWPVLILAAESADRQRLSFAGNLWPLALAVLLSAITYYAYETPLRHSTLLRARSGNALALGAGLVAVALVFSSIVLAVNESSASPATPSSTSLVGSPADVADSSAPRRKSSASRRT